MHHDFPTPSPSSCATPFATPFLSPFPTTSPIQSSVRGASRGPANLSGHWLLQSNRAMTLTARGGGHLRIARGQVWATLGPANRRYEPWRRSPLCPDVMRTDYFLSAGDSLWVPPGAQVVVESMGSAQQQPVAFDWGLSPRAPLVGWAGRWALAHLPPGVCKALRQVASAVRCLSCALCRMIRALLSSRQHVPPLEICS